MAVKLIILALCVALCHADHVSSQIACLEGQVFDLQHQRCVSKTASEPLANIEKGIIPELGEAHPNGCPIDYYITYLTAHPDCSLYYSCVYGEKVEQFCQPGLLFSYQLQACVWSWESDCREGIGGGSPPDAGAEPGNPGSPDAPAQPEPESAIPELGETNANGCPVDYYINYLTPHAVCSLYYICMYGEKLEQSCQAGLVFNYNRQACVWSWESDCKTDSEGSSSPGSGAESGNSGTGAESLVQQPQSAIPDLGETHPNGCPVDYYITYLKPHPDCANYYSCVYGEKVEQYCQPGLLFNYQLQACVWPWESDCEEIDIPDVTDAPEPPTQPEPDSAIPELGETHPNGCPVDYYITYLTPHPVCANYYSCVYGEKVEQYCQPGLLFNYRLQACVWPWESDCEEIENPDVTDAPDVPAQPDPDSAVPELGETHPNGCPVDYYINYLISHPVCSLYYICVYGEKVERSCPAGLLFSYIQQSCVWPENTDCVNRMQK